MATHHLDSSLIAWLQSLLQDPDIHQFKLVQSLWSDFGQLLRCYSPARQSHLIIKLISQPSTFNHPRGWNSQHSVQRKWRSYQIEQYFYAQFAPQLAGNNQLASLINVGQHDSMLALVLSDLNEAGFPQRHERLNAVRCKPVLSWLAKFHANYINQSPSGLWPQGSYWHLATRQDEFNKMANGSLKTHAVDFDVALRSCPHKTLIHGDAKVANFCFSNDGQSVAAVDFQYVGGGIGVQDVAYFLGSALSDAQLLRDTEYCLDYYFNQLNSALCTHCSARESAAICQSWRALYCVASADFHRFLAGWNPLHFKINHALQQQTQQAIRKVTHG